MAKDISLTIRINSELVGELEDIRKLYQERNGLEIKKTAIIESCLKEGIKVLKSNLKSEVK